MAKFNTPTNSFSSGALGADLRARFDVPQYSNGCSELVNFIPRKTGGVSRRYGSKFYYRSDIDITDPSSNGEFLIPYNHRGTTYFVGIVSGAGSSVGLYFGSWYSYDATTDTLEAHEYLNTSFPYVPFEGIESIDELQYAQLGKFLIVVSTKGRISPVVFEFVDGYYGTTATVVHSFVIKCWEQFCGVEKPLGVAWLPPNTNPDLTMQPTAIAGKPAGTLIAPEDRKQLPNTAVDDYTTITSSQPYFTQNMVGMFIRITSVSNSVYTEGIAKIERVDDENTAKVVEWVAFGVNGQVSGDWSISAFRFEHTTTVTYNEQNYFPRSVGVFQNRLIFGGSALAPNVVFMSELGEPRNFMDLKLYQDRIQYNNAYEDKSGMDYYGPVYATDAFSVPITGAQGISIQFVIGTNVVFVGTEHRPYVIRSTDGGSVAADSIEVVSPKDISCGSVMPVATSEGIVFCSHNRQDLNIASYIENTGEIVNKQVTLLNNTISYWAKNSAFQKFWDYEVKDKYAPSYISQLVWDKDEGKLWALNSRGHLSSLTIEDGAKTLAWSNHWIADGRLANNTMWDSEQYTEQTFSAVVKSIVRGHQRLFMQTIRDHYTEDSYGQYIEAIADLAIPAEAKAGFYALLDSYSEMLAYNTTVPLEIPDRFKGASAVTIARYYTSDTNAHVFKAATVPVTIFGDGKPYIQLPPDWGGVGQMRFIIGYKYESSAISMPYAVGDRQNNSVGNILRVDRAFIMFYKTKYAKLFTRYNSEVILDTTDDDTLYNTDKTVSLPHSQDTDGTMGITTDKPYPCSVLGWTLRGVYYAE